MTRALFVFVMLAGACQMRNTSAPEPTDVAAIATDAPRALDGRALVVANCLSCHGEDIVQQQRLTTAQWTKVVKKMAGWGAPIETFNEGALVDYLAANYGPNTGAYAATMIDADAAANQLAVRDDGLFGGGDPVRGRALYTLQCAACHRADGHGTIGVSLVDRPLLGHAADVAQTVHSGRGKMPAMPAVTDAEIADLLAYLRTLH